MRVFNITILSPTAALLAVLAVPGLAQEQPVADAPEAAPTFSYETGDIVLPNKTATLHLGERYRYLNPVETNKLLVAWGNFGDDTTQGAIVPLEVDPLEGNGWAVILTYLDDGHVDDADAAEIDYDEMLVDMKADTESSNKARSEAGFGTVRLIGWAEEPHYDSAARTIYWAKELDFEGSQAHTLNYDVRVLGREGVLSMNAVAGIGQLDQIRVDMRPVISMASFNEGYRYADYDAKSDRLAEYGLGALVAGGLAAKLGMFGKLGVFLLAFKKFIIIGLAGIAALLAKLFGKKKDASA